MNHKVRKDKHDRNVRELFLKRLTIVVCVKFLKTRGGQFFSFGRYWFMTGRKHIGTPCPSARWNPKISAGLTETHWGNICILFYTHRGWVFPHRRWGSSYSPRKFGIGIFNRWFVFPRFFHSGPARQGVGPKGRCSETEGRLSERSLVMFGHGHCNS